MNKRQAGFCTGKSCRNAVFILLRELEKSILEDKPLIFNFVDFKKAFDSLDWETMWKVMEAQGMPDKIVAIIKELYTNATVSVRLNQEDGRKLQPESGDQTRMLIITGNLRSDPGLCVEGIYASM